LERSTDARGRRFEIHDVVEPDPACVKGDLHGEEECTLSAFSWGRQTTTTPGLTNLTSASICTSVTSSLEPDPACVKGDLHGEEDAPAASYVNFYFVNGGLEDLPNLRVDLPMHLIRLLMGTTNNNNTGPDKPHLSISSIIGDARNAGLGKAEIEAELGRLLGVSTFIWFPGRGISRPFQDLPNLRVDLPMHLIRLLMGTTNNNNTGPALRGISMGRRMRQRLRMLTSISLTGGWLCRRLAMLRLMRKPLSQIAVPGHQ
jgi:hypothetical protein